MRRKTLFICLIESKMSYLIKNLSRRKHLSEYMICFNIFDGKIYLD